MPEISLEVILRLNHQEIYWLRHLLGGVSMSSLREMEVSEAGIEALCRLHDVMPNVDYPEKDND